VAKANISNISAREISSEQIIQAYKVALQPARAVTMKLLFKKVATKSLPYPHNLHNAFLCDNFIARPLPPISLHDFPYPL
jgi:hypothetical protein